MTSSGGRAPLLRVFPDYSADPVWTDRGMVGLDDLPITEPLRSQLRQWARDWEALMGVREARYALDDEAGYQVWRERGRDLARRLQSELGDTYRVAYEEWPP